MALLTACPTAAVRRAGDGHGGPTPWRVEAGGRGSAHSREETIRVDGSREPPEVPSREPRTVRAGSGSGVGGVGADEPRAGGTLPDWVDVRVRVSSRSNYYPLQTKAPSPFERLAGTALDTEPDAVPTSHVDVPVHDGEDVVVGVESWAWARGWHVLDSAAALRTAALSAWEAALLANAGTLHRARGLCTSGDDACVASVVQAVAASKLRGTPEAPAKNPLWELAFLYDVDKTDPHVWHYLDVYWSHMRDRRFGVRRVLELGVWNGRSLAMWHAIFPNAIIYGADVVPNVVENVAKLGLGERVRVFRGSQSDPDVLRAIVADACGEAAAVPAGGGAPSGASAVADPAQGCFDLIIDDGSHQYADQIYSFEQLMAAVAPGGLYSIEDLATSFYASFGGGTPAEVATKPPTTFDYMQRLNLFANTEAYKVAAMPSSSPEYIRRFLGDYPAMAEAITPMERLVDSVHWYHSMVLVRRRPVVQEGTAASGLRG